MSHDPQPSRTLITPDPAAALRATQTLFEAALRYHQAGLLEEAVAHYERVLILKPDLAEACCNMGVALGALGKFDAAVAQYERALVLKPRYPDALCNLGTALASQGRVDAAIAQLRLAVSCKPDSAPAHFNLALLLDRQGHREDAIEHYEKVVAFNPGHVDAQHNLGIALAAQGRSADAIPHFEAALALRPDFALARNELGIALAALGRLDEARTHYTLAVSLQPDYAEAHCNLGLVLHQQGLNDEAVLHCRRALELKPNLSDAHNNLGLALMASGRSDEAAEHYQQAIAAKPSHADAHSNLAIVLTYQGKFEQAIAHYAQAIAIRPDFIEAHYNRIDLKTFHRGDPGLSALEALAHRDGLPPHKRMFVHFALAKALEDSGEYASAFEHLRRGNALKRAQIQYDEASVAEWFNRIQQAFDRPLFEHLQGPGHESALPIFVVGMPRSGSTLIEQILSSHPLVHGGGELPDLPMAIESVLPAGWTSSDFPACLATAARTALRRIANSYVERLPLLVQGQSRIVDKLPDNFLNIGLIRLILPNARIVHTMRDPMDTCVSCYSKLFTWGVEYSYDLGELGRYYNRYLALMNHWRSVLPPGAMLEISYEDVVADMETQTRRLIEYCGLPWDARCLDFHVSARPVKTASAIQVRQPLFRTSLQRWRRYESELQPLLRVLSELAPGQPV